MKKFIIALFILLIIAGTAFGVYYFMKIRTFDNSKNNNETEIEEDDYAPIISYYNDDNEKELMKDGDIYRKHLTIMYNKGTAYIKQKSETEFKAYKDEILKDGEYTIKVETEDGKKTQKNFIIDATPPIVKGIKAGRYETAQTIEFEDINDVETATLTSNDGKVVNLKELGKSTYTVNESGTYTLKVEDKYGNGITPIIFKITLP